MKKRLFLIATVLLLVTTITVLSTYALFETNATAETDLDIGRWEIKLNNTDISLTESITLNNFVYNNGVHTEDGYFAPGSSAYFDVVIDTSDTDVSVAYDLEIDDSQIEDYPNIHFSIQNMATNQTISGTNISGVINLSDQNRTITLRISIIWDNLLAYDESDTSLIGEELAFVLNANFEQYTGA